MGDVGHAKPEWIAELGENEYIQWQGRPYRGLLPLTADTFTVAFGWVFLAFVLFLFLVVLSVDTGGDVAGLVVVCMFLALFIAIGIYMTIWQHVADAFLRRHSMYALSNFRAFIGTELPGKRWVKTYPINLFTPVEIDEHYAGGTVWFARFLLTDELNNDEVSEPSMVSFWDDRTFPQRIGFVGIPDYRDVFERMQRMRVMPT